MARWAKADSHDSNTLGQMETPLEPRVASPRTSPTQVHTPFLELAIALGAGAAIAGVASVLLVGFASVSLAAVFVAYAVATFLIVVLMKKGFPHPTLGVANVVTIGRMALVIALIAPLFSPAPPWTMVAVGLAALFSDGIDGWMARREQRVSQFGERLDVEVDSALALVLSLNALVTGDVTWLVILLGIPRYLFVGAGVVFPWLTQSLPESQARKVICVVQVATLIALQLPWFAIVLGWFLVAVVAGALLWSFGRDVVWLWRTRG